MRNEAELADHLRTTVPRVAAWFSTGIASAVMVALELRTPGLVIVNCDLRGSEDDDNERFLRDCRKWWRKPIQRIKSAKYDTIDDVFEKRRYLSGINGAPCTGEMKFVPRLDWQLPSDTHLFGYTADASDVTRAEKFVATYPDMKLRFPLIERGITKAACSAILSNAGIREPAVYGMGYPNGNCPGCVKATSPDYWALVRLRHPETFARRADQSRRFGARLARINDERVFIDEIPADWPVTKPIVPSCDFLCHLAKQDIAA